MRRGRPIEEWVVVDGESFVDMRQHLDNGGLIVVSNGGRWGDFDVPPEWQEEWDGPVPWDTPANHAGAVGEREWVEVWPEERDDDQWASAVLRAVAGPVTDAELATLGDELERTLVPSGFLAVPPFAPEPGTAFWSTYAENGAGATFACAAGPYLEIKIWQE